MTRPVVQLARAAQEVAAGNWDTRVEVSGGDEVGQLADSFNRMTTELLAQKERLVQTERVAAWRELARRLAHELKNPLFPLQLTVENLMRARAQTTKYFTRVRVLSWRRSQISKRLSAASVSSRRCHAHSCNRCR